MARVQRHCLAVFPVRTASQNGKPVYRHCLLGAGHLGPHRFDNIYDQTSLSWQWEGENDGQAPYVRQSESDYGTQTGIEGTGNLDTPMQPTLWV